MCGIFGIQYLASDLIPDQDRLNTSVQLMSHRGPDSCGIYSENGIGLAHTRLSLLDLSTRSNQPFWDRENKYCLVYNGEIYNFQQLRSELEDKGIIFRTTSDTEVLLECLIYYGVDDTLNRLDGMFAFAFYEKQSRNLIIARDRFGIKPLYVYENNRVFIFASEIRALSPWVTFELDVLSISSYLQGFAQPSKGYSFYKNIQIVPPGTVIKISKGSRVHYGRFFCLSDFWDEAETDRLKRLKPKQIVDKVDELLLNSVKKQLVADTPVGALCSGGVDSSVIMAMACKFHNNLAIFHANVVGPFTEYEAALALSKHLKLDLKVVDTVEQDFVDLIPEVVEHYGHPYGRHPNSVPFLKVSKLIQNHHVKAVLSGEGSDECFLGYNHLAFNLRKYLMEIPRQSYYQTLRQTARKLLGRWIPKPVFENIACEMRNRFEHLLEKEDILRKIQGRSEKKIHEKDMASLYLLSYHLRTLLHRNDCLGMAASIEARFPFLDHELVKVAVNMPYNSKIRFSPLVFEKEHYFLRDKWVIRKVADRYIPAGLSQRKKVGFQTSAQNLMLIPAEFFEGSFISELFGLSKRQIQYMLAHANQKFRYRLLLLEVWAQICFHNVAKEQVTKRLRDYIKILDHPLK